MTDSDAFLAECIKILEQLSDHSDGATRAQIAALIRKIKESIEPAAPRVLGINVSETVVAKDRFSG